MNYIYQEYSQRIAASAQIVQSINATTNLINANLSGIQATINSTIAQIGTLSDAINNFGNFIEKIYSAVIIFLLKQTQIKKNGLNAFYGIFGIILALNVLNLVGVIMFGIFKFQIFRYFSHIAWFCLALLIILTFILGSFFAIFGVLGMDLGISFTYLFSSTQINNLFSTNAQAAQLLNVCINSDGDIANQVFNLSNTNVNSITTLQNASSQMGILAANLTNNSQSISIPLVNSLYTTYQNDIVLTFSSTNNGAAWYDWSDSSLNSFMSQCSGVKGNERWVQNLTKCSSGYSYALKSAATMGSKVCLLMSDWDLTVILINL